MRSIGRIALILLSLCLLVVAVLIFTPVPIVRESKALVEIGRVTEIYANPGNDVIFKLEGTSRRFYINRGLENGLDLQYLKQRLVGKTIVVKYPKYWTPLDWDNTVRHISKLEFEGEVLFNELKE